MNLFCRTEELPLTQGGGNSDGRQERRRRAFPVARLCFEFYGQKLPAFEAWSGCLGYFVVLRNLERASMDEGQRARLRRLVTELTDGGQDWAGLPRHKTGLVDRLREQGRHEEAVMIENGTGFWHHRKVCT